MASQSLIVTGGSSGIGRALAFRAGASGWRVHVGYNGGAGRAEAVAAQIVAAGGDAAPVRLPLNEPATLREAVDRLASEPTAPSALALCASPAPNLAPFTKQTAEWLRAQLDASIVGNHALLSEVWRRCFRSNGGGTVLAVLTAATGPTTASHMAGYIAAKAGLEYLLRAAAAELGRAGLRIAVVRPGHVDTPMLDVFPELVIEKARAASPAGRFLTPEEVAATLHSALVNPPAPGLFTELGLPSPAELPELS